MTKLQLRVQKLHLSKLAKYFSLLRYRLNIILNILSFFEGIKYGEPIFIVLFILSRHF